MLQNASTTNMYSANTVTLGVDLGGTSVRVGLYDRQLTLLASHAMPTRVADGPQSVVEEIASTAHRLLQWTASNGAPLKPLGIGIGSPGPINLRAGVLGLLPNLPGWDNFPLRDALAQASGLPVTLESDANAAALAEWKLGAGRAAGLGSMAMITLGTGVGSGIILNGKVWQGMFGMGGEVGHATVNPEGPPCPCGSRGCLELYASANGLIRIARSIAANGSATEALRELADRPDGFAPVDVAALADRGDRSAQLVFERIGFYLGIGIANLINTLDLPLIAVGGGMASAWHLFCSSMFRTVREFSVVYRLAEPTQHLTLETDRTYLCPAMLGPSAGLMGAGLLPYLELEAAEKNRARSPTENLA